jgi:hypothetical protein
MGLRIIFVQKEVFLQREDGVDNRRTGQREFHFLGQNGNIDMQQNAIPFWSHRK